MKNYTVAIFLILTLGLFAQVGTEFPINVSSDSTFLTGFAEDNDKYLLLIRRERGTQAEIVAQFHSKANHTLIGNPIVLGTTVIGIDTLERALIQADFDGNNFLVVWTNGINGGIRYRFINAQNFQLSQLYSDPTYPCYLSGIPYLHYNQAINKYILVSAIRSQNNYYLNYTFIRPNGFMESSNPVANMPVRAEYSIAYGSSRYLVVFIYDNRIIYGQFINENGTLIGQPFIIDDSPAQSDNPLSVTYDGSKFICLFPDEEMSGWKIYSRFIYPNGTVSSDRYLVSSSGWLVPYGMVFPNGILITSSFINPFNFNECFVNGRFFDLNLTPIGNEFTIFSTLNSKVPVFGLGEFAGDKFYIYTNRVDVSLVGGQLKMRNGDIYGVSVLPPTSVKSSFEGELDFNLLQNYPNPFNPVTKIKFSIVENSQVKLTVYNLLGEVVRTLVNQPMSAGNYEIEFDASGLPSGMYLYKIEAGSKNIVKKMMLAK